ncbi:hypothetical protein MPS_4326 [Mycobacterium pseudoshottsii JCM 15466]|nr:hypothetical protein DL240490_03522 [Mycobacterium marinum]BEH78033.1 hypothetical protein YM3MPS_38360 [Mycobacterium pseudoshottsii]GAQ38672.1 hypothetical protein MPS_4326 [Mycobacterium pseudoshottsii JCM 15466]
MAVLAVPVATELPQNDEADARAVGGLTNPEVAAATTSVSVVSNRVIGMGWLRTV